METNGSQNPPLDYILSKLNQIYTLTFYLLKTRFSNILSFNKSKWSFPYDFPTKLLHACLSSLFILHASPITPFFI